MPGEVKTRLCPPLSPAGAADVYEAFLVDVVRCCRRVVSADLVLFSAGHPAGWRPPGADDLPCLPQRGADLGERMTHALETLFERGARLALLVGSDTPTLPPRLIEATFQLLERVDLVLGPTRDGGYWTIGLARPPADLLAGIAWSTSSVLAATEHRARRLGFSLDHADPWYDVDTPSDLAALAADLAKSEGAGEALEARATRAALRRLGLLPA